MFINNIRVKAFLLFLFLIVTLFGWAQKTGVYTDEYVAYREAQELFDKEKFSPAQEKFLEVINAIKTPQNETKINAEYYYAICALELFHQDAEYLLSRFAVEHPEHSKAQTVYFQLGLQKYRLKKFKSVIEYFEQVDPYYLSDNEKTEYEFKLGYSYFYVKKYSEAKVHFAAIKDESSSYQTPALYYYSHIAYTEKNYQTALNGFKQISDSEMFKNIVPYYVAQIYHKQKKYEELIDYAPQYFETISKKRRAEYAKLIGDAYYFEKRYKEAIPYLKEFKKGAKSTRISNYQLAYAYYQTKDYQNAVNNYKRVSSRRDTLSQIAMYQLGDCFLQFDNRLEARIAFKAASKLHFDPEIQENALFNYAKLAYQIDGPYSESTEAFLEYIDKYPKSEQLDEAYEFLIKGYMTTKKYDEALASIEKIKRKDNRIKQAYQNIAFNRGIELFQNNQYDEAIVRFKQVEKYPFDKKTNAASLYWTGEAYYKKKDYEQAIDKFVEFRLEPGAALTNVFREADYSVAYAYFMKAHPFKDGELNVSSENRAARKSNLEKSITAFRNFIQLKDRVDAKKLEDAYLRLADCYYLLPDDKLAVANYSKAINIGQGNMAYAYFQKAKSQGLLGDIKGKAKTLKALTDKYPKSTYQVLSLRELAQAYQQQGNNDKAIKVYKDFIKDYPNNRYVPEMMVNLGGIYVREKNYNEAEVYLLRVLDEYPSATIEKESAIAQMKSVFIGRDDLPGYYDWLKRRGVSVESAEVDSALWEPVYMAWNKGDCNLIERESQTYLQKVPNGVHQISAHFYLATCYYTTDQNKSLEHYNFVISKPNNEYYEEALQYGSQISYANGDYETAKTNYNKLESVAANTDNITTAIIQQMWCNWKLNDYPNAIAYADKVLALSGLEDVTEVEALRIKGLSLRETRDYENAKAVLRACNNKTKSIKGAEAKYYVAEILYEEANYEECELEIMELVNQKPSYDYWIAKAILLLGENFIALEDYYNARSSLQSVIDNYEGKDDVEIKQKAQDRIDYIDALESQNQNKSGEEDIEELDLNND
jgi:TolA-binding protein